MIGSTLDHGVTDVGASSILSNSLMMIADQPLLLVLAIVVATFVLEDIATITVALLASHMVINGGIALAALVAGTVLGDLAVFFIARRAAHVPLVSRFLHRAAAKPVFTWLERNALSMVVIARFTPGLRLPVFAGAGSLGVPAGGFTVVIILSTLIWTPGLYWVVTSLGMAGLERLGVFGWLIPLGLVGAMALAPRIVGALIERQPARLLPA